MRGKGCRGDRESKILIGSATVANFLVHGVLFVNFLDLLIGDLRSFVLVELANQRTLLLQALHRSLVF